MKTAEQFVQDLRQMNLKQVVAAVEKRDRTVRNGALVDAAGIANSAKVREDSHNTKASVQVCIMQAILAARDKV